MILLAGALKIMQVSLLQTYHLYSNIGPKCIRQWKHLP